MLNAVTAKNFAGLAASSGKAAAAKQRAANCTAVALAGLAGLAPLAKRVRGDGADKLAEKVLHLASCMLEDQVSDPCLARAGAETMAAAACIGSTTLALSQVGSLFVAGPHSTCHSLSGVFVVNGCKKQRLAAHSCCYPAKHVLWLFTCIVPPRAGCCTHSFPVAATVLLCNFCCCVCAV